MHRQERVVRSQSFTIGTTSSTASRRTSINTTTETSVTPTHLHDYLREIVHPSRKLAIENHRPVFEMDCLSPMSTDEFMKLKKIRPWESLSSGTGVSDLPVLLPEAIPRRASLETQPDRTSLQSTLSQSLSEQYEQQHDRERAIEYHRRELERLINLENNSRGAFPSTPHLPKVPYQAFSDSCTTGSHSSPAVIPQIRPVVPIAIAEPKVVPLETPKQAQKTCEPRLAPFRKPKVATVAPAKSSDTWQSTTDRMSIFSFESEHVVSPRVRPKFPQHTTVPPIKPRPPAPPRQYKEAKRAEPLVEVSAGSSDESAKKPAHPKTRAKKETSRAMKTRSSGWATTKPIVQSLRKRAHPSASSECSSPSRKRRTRSIRELKPKKTKTKILDKLRTQTNSETCWVCSKSSELVYCDRCPRAFHLKCIGSTRSDMPEGKWHCSECQQPPTGLEEIFNGQFKQLECGPLCRVIWKCLLQDAFAKRFIQSLREDQSESGSEIKWSTIETNLKSSKYTSLESFTNDMDQIWRQARSFYTVASGMRRVAEILAERCEILLDSIVLMHIDPPSLFS